MKKISLLILLSLVACKSGQKSTQGPLKIGAISGPELELVTTAAAVAKKSYNVDVEVVAFSDYVAPNEALMTGQIDANAFQHQPYLDEFKKSRGAKISVLGKTFLYPMGVYSKKIKSLNDIAPESKVSIPNDPSNEGRALVILQQAGLIKLPPEKGVHVTVVDIVENPKKLKIITLEAAQLPRALDDVQAAVINTNYAKPAGLVHGKDTIFIEQTSSPYTNLIASREDNKNDARLLQFVKSYQTSEVVQKAKELFGDQAVPGF